MRVAIFDTWPVGPEGDPALGKIVAFRNGKFDGTIDPAQLYEAADGTLVAPDRFSDHVAAWPGYPVRPVDCDSEPMFTYDQSDHGLFIAGIIKDIAPLAELYVYRTMPDRGCGDLYDVVEAISKAVADLCTGPDARKPLIFNMSFGVAPDPHLIRTVMANLDAVYSYEGAANLRGWLRERYAQIYEGVGPDDEGGVEGSARLRDDVVRRKVERLEADRVLSMEEIPASERTPGAPEFRPVLSGEARLIQELMDILARRNILLVAAAGNDACTHQPRPEPRLPAKIEGVLGVSAAKHLGGVLTSYSNYDDWYMPDDGIAAVGGEVAGSRSTQGLYGLFVSDTVPVKSKAADPNNPPNVKGLVRWAGTSFATPVAVGFAACLWSEMYSVNAFGMPVFDPAETVLTAIVKNPNGVGERRVIPIEQQGWS